MRTRLELDTEKPNETVRIIKPSLDSTNNIKYTVETQGDNIVVDIQAHGLGPLRGCTDTVFRLVSLAEKIV